MSHKHPKPSAIRTRFMNLSYRENATGVAAEQTALERLSVELADQIVARVALYASRGGAAQ